VTLRMIIPGREIGVIIGKGGETIHQIRAESEAKIFITDGSVPERVVTVSGTGDSVCMAYNLMCCRLEAGEDGKEIKKEQLNLRLVVAAAQCGSIIGKGGSKIKEIRETCGASVNVGSDLLPGSSERCVTVQGPREKVVEVIYQIVNILSSKPFVGSVVQYKPGCNIQAFAPGMGPITASDGRRGGGGGGGGGMGGAAGGLGMMGGAAGMGGMGPGGLMGPSGSAGAFAALASIAGSQIRRNDKDRDRSHDTSHQMTVSNELIGSIIGKGGSKIAEIRQMSGANIQISKGTDKDQNNATEREINISGPPEAVTLAKSLINMSLELHQLEKNEECDPDQGGGNAGNDDEGSGRRGGGGYNGGRGGNYGGGNYAVSAAQNAAALGPVANREVMQALNTLAHFNNMTNGSLFGGGFTPMAAGMSRGGRQQNNGRGRDERNGAVRNKFSPY